MKTSKRDVRKKRANIADTEVRFLRMYSDWHETHDLSLRRRLLLRLSLIRRRFPDFDLRRPFQQAF